MILHCLKWNFHLVHQNNFKLTLLLKTCSHRLTEKVIINSSWRKLVTILRIIQPYKEEERCVFRFIFNVTDVDGDLATVEAASSTGILEQANNNMKAIQFDQDFPYPANHPAQFIQLFHSLERDISNQGFPVWFNRIMAQAFLLNVYLGTDVSFRDLYFFGRANSSIGLEAKPREITLFYFELSLWSRQSMWY